MFCHNCGKELFSGCKFCPDCGTKVHDTTANVVNSTELPETSGTKDAQSLYECGCKQLDSEQYTEAIKTFTKAIELDHGNAKLYNKRDEAYTGQEDYQNALKDGNEAIKLDPANADYYYSRGLTYQNLEDYPNALKDYTEAIKLDPTNASYYSARGMTYYYLKDYSNALKDYTEAIRLNPDDDNYYEARGMVYIFKEDISNALKDYNNAVRLNPNNKDYKKILKELKSVQAMPKNSQQENSSGIKEILVEFGAKFLEGFLEGIMSDDNDDFDD